MGTLRIEFYPVTTRIDAEVRDALGGQTLAVTSAVTAAGSRPVVPQSPFVGGTLVELEAIDAPIYVDLGPVPDPTANPAFLIIPGLPRRVLASPGDLISAVLANDITTPPVVVRSGQLVPTTATIASGTSLAAAVDLGTARLVGIGYPAAWTASGLTFSVSADGTTYFDLFDGGTERSLTVTAGKLDARPLSDWLGVRFLKLRSGTSATPVNQAADRVFTLVTAP